jgi:O-antigen ligase
MLLTVTRGIWLAAIVGTALVLITTAELRRFILPIVATGTLLVVASFALIPGLARQASERQKAKSPVYERQNTSAAGLRMVADRPLLGFGWDRANDRLEPYFTLQPNIPLIGLNAGLHDIYLQYLVALGAAGFGIWLLGGLLAFGGALGKRAPPDIRPWQIGLKGVLAASLIVGVTTPSAYIFTTTLFWTLGGIVWGATATATSPARAVFSRNGREPALAAAGAVLR